MNRKIWIMFVAVMVAILFYALPIEAQEVEAEVEAEVNDVETAGILPDGVEISYSDLVRAVSFQICEVQQNHSECGNSCTSTRRDRQHIPDENSHSRVELEDCDRIAEAFIDAALNYEVPLAEIWATAYQESRFRELSLGGGTECGMFQQTTNYIRFSSPYSTLDREAWSEDFGTDGILSRSEDICVYLLDLDNALFHFALKYHHERGQNGDNWPAYYNGGPNMWVYQESHRSYQRTFERYLENTYRALQELFYDP